MYEIVISGKKDNKEIYLLENGILVEMIKEQKNIEGNIYLGKVQNILPGMQAAFIDIGEDKNAFIHLKDILPKNDSKIDNPLNNIEDFDIKKYVKIGMPLLVEIKRDATCKKGSRASTHINLAGRYLVYMPKIILFF